MSKIDLPIRLADIIDRDIHARVSATVNLPDPAVKGIHMSRLYTLLLPFSSGTLLSPVKLESLLNDILLSHEGCSSNAAFLTFSFELLLKKDALKTPDLSGWTHYPVEITASQEDQALTITAKVGVGYASTCPCSAALSRQLIAERFQSDYPEGPVEVADVVTWIRQNGTYATPHSQRSLANVKIEIPACQSEFGLLPLINRIEHTLSTPLQTTVKRIDEQAFAELNGQNLMFVEDAVRHLRSALSKEYAGLEIDVSHFESLHPHDAIARAHF